MKKTPLILQIIICLSALFSCQIPKESHLAIQPLAGSILLKKAKETGTDSALVAIMEVKTGRIVALSSFYKINDSLKKRDNQLFFQPQEPGTIFKTVAILAALENGASLDDSIDLENGECRFFDSFVIRDQDSTWPPYKVTLNEALLRNSNIAVAKTTHQIFGTHEEEFRKSLNSMLLSPIYAKDTIVFKFPFKGTNVMASIGYGFRVSPRQILAFYNAIANNGNMVVPDVDSIKQQLDRHICSTGNIEKINRLLQNFADSSQLAGKVGVAQLILQELRYATLFCGYFPKEKPRYSMISIFHNTQPRNEYPFEVCNDIANIMTQRN